MASAERKRELRAQAKSEAEASLDARVKTSWKYPATAVGLIDWAEATVPITDGLLAGSFFRCGHFQREIYEAVLARDGNYPKYYTVGSFCPRKTGKSFTGAILIGSRLAGNLCRGPFRMGVVSVSQDLCKVIKMMVVDMLTAAGLDDLIEVRENYITGRFGSRVDFLPSSVRSGMASGYDLTWADELGIHPNADELLAQLRGSLAARDGQLVATSVRGFADAVQGILDDSEQFPHVWARLYAAPEDCDIQDPAAWEMANPSLGTVKSRRFLEAEAAEAAHSPLKAAHFATWHLNHRSSPTKIMIVTPTQFARCLTDNPVEKSGRCVVGIDLGSTVSLSGWTAVWESGRVECGAVVAGNPDLRQRGKLDSCGLRYQIAQEQGELHVQEGRRSVDVAQFIRHVAAQVDYPITAIVCDRYREGELLDALQTAGLNYPQISFRGYGFRDGGEDCRSFEKAVADKWLSMRPSLTLAASISDSCIQIDDAGNSKISKAKSTGRIDVLCSTIIAVAMMQRMMAAPKPTFDFWIG